MLVLGRWVGGARRSRSCSRPFTLLVAAVRTQVAFLQVVRLFDLGPEARTDELTGLPNRRRCYETSAAALRRPGPAPRRAARRPGPLQGDQRQARPPRRRRGAAPDRPPAAPPRCATATCGPARRRRVRRGAARRRRRGRPDAVAERVRDDARRAVPARQHHAARRAPASASPSPRTTADDADTCCSGPTWPCTRRRPTAAAYGATPRPRPAQPRPPGADRGPPRRHRPPSELVRPLPAEARRARRASRGVEALVRWQHPAAGCSRPTRSCRSSSRAG